MTTPAGSPSESLPISARVSVRKAFDVRRRRPTVTLVEERADFAAFYASEYRPIVALAWSLTGSRTAAEELAQDGFLDAFRSWERLARYDRPGAWVRRAVINRAVSRSRRARTEASGLRRLVVEQRNLGGEATSPDPANWDEPFWAEVRALPDRQAQCVALHYLEDLAVREIAEVLGCREATVKVHLHRGRLALARRLGESQDRTNGDHP